MSRRDGRVRWVRCGGALLAAAFLVGLSGCAGGGAGEMAGNHQRADASGSVTFKGQPIVAGTVSFTNVETGIQSNCPIDDGAYENDGDGPVVGKNLVSIVGLEAADGKPMWGGTWSREVQVEGDSFQQDFEVKEDEVKPYKDIGMDEEAPLYE